MVASQQQSINCPYPRQTRERLKDKSPSVKLVSYALQRHSELTMDELGTSTLLPPRTIRYAIKELRSENLVESRAKLDDVRKKSYEWIGTDA